MVTPGRPLAVALVGSLLAGSVLAGCTSEDPPRPAPARPGVPSRGIDTASYFEHYASEAAGDTSAGSSKLSGPVAVGGTARGTAAGGAVGSPAVPGWPGPGHPPYVPGPLEDDTFVDAGTSGFVETARDARSTFALDVDTGSWTVARTLLRTGLLPPPASIRVEEWVNAVPAGLPEPEGTLGVSADSAPAPNPDDGNQLVRVGIGTRTVRESDRRPVNLTLVVDRSGSMDIRERLGLVQSSLAVLADSLRDDDTVSVVSFDDRARPLLEATPVSDTEAILAAVDRLTPGGSTNLEAGLRLGYQEARASFRDDATNVVVLASDGVANVGRTGPGSIVEEIREQGLDGIHLVTVGYGMGNYNDHLMEQLADLGDGFYAYVDDLAEAEAVFRDRITTALVPVAAQARAQVAFDPTVVSSYRLIGYDNRGITDEQFDDQAVDAGELGAGHHATALYEVRLAEGVRPGTPIGTATVQWTSVADGSTERASAPLVAGGSAAPDGAFALQAVVADLAQLLKHASSVAERDVTLAGLARRTAALVEAGVPGAPGVAEMIRLATTARATPPPPDLPPPPIR
jgi:Ca-activated chloride channel family protein